jgi:hypothetical protein
VFLATETQVMISGINPFDVSESKDYEEEQAAQAPLWGVWNYFLSHDTLVLWIPSDTIRAVNDQSGPTAAQWMPFAPLSGVFAAPHTDDADMTWHDGTLWYGNARGSDYIYSINASTGAAVDSIYTTRSAYCLEWVDTNLWVSSNGSDGIFNIDTANNTLRNVIYGLGSWPYGMAYHGSVLYVYCNNGNSLYRCDPSGLSVLDSLQMSFWLGGMTSDGSNLWFCSDVGIHRAALVPGKDAAGSQALQVTASYRIPGYRPYGLAFDGTDFWVAVYDNEYRLFIGRVTLPAT